MKHLAIKLNEQFAESRELEKKIRDNLESLNVQ